MLHFLKVWAIITVTILSVLCIAGELMEHWPAIQSGGHDILTAFIEWNPYVAIGLWILTITGLCSIFYTYITGEWWK